MCANMGVSASMYFLYFFFGSFSYLIVFSYLICLFFIYPTVFYSYSLDGYFLRDRKVMDLDKRRKGTGRGRRRRSV